jgi:hypothetical protein
MSFSAFRGSCFSCFPSPQSYGRSIQGYFSNSRSLGSDGLAGSAGNAGVGEMSGNGSGGGNDGGNGNGTVQKGRNLSIMSMVQTLVQPGPKSPMITLRKPSTQTGEATRRKGLAERRTSSTPPKIVTSPKRRTDGVAEEAAGDVSLSSVSTVWLGCEASLMPFSLLSQYR